MMGTGNAQEEKTARARTKDHWQEPSLRFKRDISISSGRYLFLLSSHVFLPTLSLFCRPLERPLPSPPPAMASHAILNQTYGALLVGWAASSLYANPFTPPISTPSNSPFSFSGFGVICIQTWSYFQRYPRDRASYKLLVAAVWYVSSCSLCIPLLQLRSPKVPRMSSSHACWSYGILL